MPATEKRQAPLFLSVGGASLGVALSALVVLAGIPVGIGLIVLIMIAGGVGGTIRGFQASVAKEFNRFELGVVTGWYLLAVSVVGFLTAINPGYSRRVLLDLIIPLAAFVVGAGLALWAHVMLHTRHRT
jgi:hypothetical protein